MKREKVVVGLSGGVDSSVAALLLKEQGYDVIGVTMKTWDGAESIIEDAKRVADFLSIPYHVIDFTEEFHRHVVDYFAEEYLHGRTPNPCVVCNRHVKWEALLDRSREFGAELVATGHYARVEKLQNGRYALRSSVTAAKDQTYALYNLTQDQLARTLMPVGSFEKEEIRQIAREAGIPVAEKPDSQEICFIPDQDYAGFIERYTGKQIQPGNFVDQDGRILGRHKGIIHYTVGQRKGLNLALGHPVFVTEIRPDTNEVVIGTNEDVFTKSLLCSKLNWMAVDGFHGSELRMLAKIRYAHKGAMCTIREAGEDLAECVFDEPVRAVTPGQAVVFYQDDWVAGGGIIQ
ncbi:MAG: tRNA 2-thiouridine(34) synthase MnmA [Lachnospiraceae bacterium]|jgi:tRNA-specific 2-thiouridylase